LALHFSAKTAMLLDFTKRDVRANLPVKAELERTSSNIPTISRFVNGEVSFAEMGWLALCIMQLLKK